MNDNATTVLVVEDEAIVAADLAGKLEQMGYAVVGTAGEGEQAVELASRLRPDIILMDIRLGDSMDGIQAAKAIAPLHDAPVIYLTAHSDPSTLARAKLTGPFGYVLKPFMERDLAAQIELACYKHQSEKELARQQEALRHSEERLRRAMTAGNIFTFEWHPDTDHMYRSEDCCSILGIGPDGCNTSRRTEHCDRIHEEDRKGFLKRLHGLTPDAPEYEIEYRYRRGDGRIVWLEESGQAEFDERGKLVMLRGIAADVTDRVEARRRETAMAAAQSAVDTVNAMGEGVVLFRPEGTILTVNPAAETLSGLTRDQLIGGNLRTIVANLLRGEDLTMTLQALDDVARGISPSLGPVVVRRSGQSPVTISPSVVFIQGSEDTKSTVVLTLKDVSELHESNELLTQVFDNTHMQMAYLDKDFTFLRVNRAYADACRHEPDFFVGKNHFTLYPHKENKAIFRRVRDTGEMYMVYEKPFEFPEQSDRGTTYWDWSLRPIHDENGATAGLLFCLLDVTERVRTRHKFFASEAKYRELVENANSIIMRITPDHRITFFNEYAQTFFGYRADEILGRSVIDTIVPAIDSEGRDLTRLVEAVVTNPELHGSKDNENMCKDGRRVWIHWSNRAIRDEQGLVREILCVGTDITERRRMQSEAEQYRRRLRALSDRLATTEEQERRLVSSQIHDTVIQTLSLSSMRLAAVLGGIKAVGLVAEQEQVQLIRTLIDRAIGECRGLMADLTPPLLYELGLAAALKDFAERQREFYDIPITVQDEGPCEPLDGSLRGLLFQSARELIVNAAKHAGPCRITVKLMADNDAMYLQVNDTGKGFDMNAVELFDVDDAGGFGLFNIRERLRGLGGNLDIVSHPGAGTTATIRVPVG